jgi:gliding motility-associated-like protein
VPSSICEGDLINLPAISVNEVTGNWSPEINTNETTTYTFTPNPNQCALLTELTISVEPINIISLNATIISDLFTETLSIELNVIGGNGDYEYKIDNAAWQSSTIFEDLENEIVYTFSARQINGCSNIAVASAQGLSFPTFFTPNGDGFNDYWNIRSLKNQQNAVIHIFDRYGKLLVELNPSQIGWDGIYNGKPLPSNDYWFNVKFTDPRTGNLVNYVNHFTLRR